MKSINSNPINYYKLPPQNILAEEILLGSLLTNNTTHFTTISNIKSEFFALEKHKKLYTCIVKNYNKNTYLNIIQFIYSIWEEKILQLIGGLTKIRQLIQQSQTVFLYNKSKKYLQEYFELIYNCYTKRLFIQYCNQILQLTYLTNISSKKLYEQSNKYLEKIAKTIEIQKNNQIKKLISDFLIRLHTDSSVSLTNNKPISSGFIELDQIAHGFDSGDLIVIAARPSMGKTSLAITITNHILIKLKLGVCFFSLEMSKLQILDKIISAESNIPLKYIRYNIINNNQWSRIHKLCSSLLNSSLYIDDTPDVSIKYFESKITYIKYQIKKNT